MTVRAEATIRTEPDEAMVVITLSTLEEGSGAPLTQVALRSEALISLVGELGIVGKDRSTTGVAVREEFDHKQRARRSPGHRAEANIVVRGEKSETIGESVMRASGDPTHRSPRRAGASLKPSPPGLKPPRQPLSTAGGRQRPAPLGRGQARPADFARRA